MNKMNVRSTLGIILAYRTKLKNVLTWQRVSQLINEPRCEKTVFFFFAYAKTKTYISCAVTTQLISAFVFATQIVQSLYLLNPKVQASSYLLWLYSPVCVGSGRNPERWFSHDAAQMIV